MDIPENEAVKTDNFGFDFREGYTSYVQTPRELYIPGKSKVPPEATYLLCVVEIVDKLQKLPEPTIVVLAL